MTKLSLQDLKVLRSAGESITDATAHDYAGIKMAEDAKINNLMPRDWLIGTAFFEQLTASSVTMKHVLFYLKDLVQSIRHAYRTADEAIKVYKDMMFLHDAGVLMIMLECVPWKVTEKTTKYLKVLTMKTGAGIGCDGQGRMVPTC